MSKTIYQPTGRAREYALWACNLYVGCSNDCDYCYCKRGALGTAMGKPMATLKKYFKDENDAHMTFQKELKRYHERMIADGGLFFSFSTDPCLPEAIGLTMKCVRYAIEAGVPCRILTKCARWILEKADEWDFLLQLREMVTVGFTLTGCDEKERGASSNADRVKALRQLSDAGFKTFASVEPIIDFDKSLEMVKKSTPWCDEYRFGLLSGNRDAYNDINLKESIRQFINQVHACVPEETKIFWKQSIRQAII